MPSELIALPPVAFVAWLLLASPGVGAGRPARVRVAAAFAAGVLLGPVLLAVAGPFGWLLLLALATVALTGFAARRRAGRLPRRPWRGPLRTILHR